MYRGLEPCYPRRQLEQQPGELPGSESEQEQSEQPQQQHWLPPGSRPVVSLLPFPALLMSWRERRRGTSEGRRDGAPARFSPSANDNRGDKTGEAG